MKRTVDWLLTDADWVVIGNDSMDSIRSGAVAIDGNRLVAVGPSPELKEIFQGRRCMDLSGHLLLPGLINTHTHAAMSCFRGLGDDMALHQWLQEVIFPAEAKNVSSELVYWGTLLSCIEMLKGGVTTFCDGYFFEEWAARAALESGIRAVLGQGILDFPTPDQPDPKQSRKRAETFLEGFPKGVDRLRPSLFCHAPYTCGAETLQWVKALCRDKDILFQIHLSETSSEVEDLVRQHGMAPVHYLDSLGVLDEKTLCAHAVWVDRDEIEVLARRGAGVSHTPESNMKLASGVAPVPAMFMAGVPVGLGTDGCASNNDLDMFAEMDTAAKLHKVFQKDCVLCSARQILKMGTSMGAAALGMHREIGSLEPGKRADLVAIDLRQPHLTPLYDPISHLVYAVRGSDVRHVWVDGNQVVSNGCVLTVDEDRVVDEVNGIVIKNKIN